MNGYVCFFRGRRLEVRAPTQYAAQLEAARIFKARRAHEVSALLAERDGVPVVHAPQEVAP